MHGLQTNRYHVFELATSLASPEIAYRSISMGGPQIMGSEYWRLGGGYRDAKDMLDYFQAYEHYQVIAFFDFSRSKGVLQYVDKSKTTKDWTSFAKFYNGVTARGPEYQAAYAAAKQLALP